MALSNQPSNATTAPEKTGAQLAAYQEEMKPMARYFSGKPLKWWMGLFYLFLYAPMVVLVIYSFNQNRLAMVWSGFSTEWYAKLFANTDIWRSAMNSIIVAFTAAPLSVIFALTAAYIVVRGMDFLGKALIMVAVILPLIIPEMVSAVASLMFFSTMHINWGLGNVIIAHTVFCLPFAYVPLRSALLGMDANLEMAARDLYASEWQIFRLVTLPILRNAIFSAFALAFVISLDDFIITLMVANAGSGTLPVYIYSMIRQGVTPEVNAISTLYLLVSVGLVSIYLLLSKNKTPVA
ncbi:MAG: ABC transporter permease [Hydrotalea sp.]|nr:ABC transporter permease [Hydrotalea sp.]